VIIPPILLRTTHVSRGAGGKDEPKFAPTDAEQKLLELINLERQNHKLPRLKASPLLFQTARAHALNMAKQSKMAHVLDGKDQFQRIKGTGYRYRYASENVARGEVEADLPDIVKRWMQSEVHRKNILDVRYTETGLGIARFGKDSEGKEFIYYAQEFAVPRPKVPDEDP
jgi:uncharacterized protein YkwD